MENRKQICNDIITTEPQMEKLILKYFTVEDMCKVAERKIGAGLIGGKACGLLTAYKLIEIYLPDCEECLNPHNSWFVGTEVFRHYIKSEGQLDSAVIEGLRKMLDFYGETPLIVRSSSIMEDGYENAFSGKYESVFCANQGTEEERLEEITDAVRRVYDSAGNSSALEYRKRRHLLDKEEEMALLIQPVAGRKIGSLYFPIAAGMGCSYNPYKWMEKLNPEAGMLRLVMGLGTRAVERTPGDYPRLVGLDRAQANLRTTDAERHKYSQRMVDVLDLEERRICTKNLGEMIDILPEFDKKLLLSRDFDAEYILEQRRNYRKVYFADCQGLVERKEFIHMMRRILKLLEEEYGRPVDVEFAVTEKQTEENMQGWALSLLQCRPLQAAPSEQITIPENIDSQILFDVRRTSMRRSKKEKIDYIVWVDPRRYYECPYAKKPDVARMVGQINQYFREKGKKLMLLVPGRIGTSSPELGVPVSYAEISGFCAICEVAYGEVGYHPELSYGSHMFQDMIEADVYYGAINENSKTRLYQPELLESCKEVLAELWPEKEELSEIVKLYDVSEQEAELILDAKEGRSVCRL